MRIETTFLICEPGVSVDELPLALALVGPVAELETLLTSNLLGRNGAGKKQDFLSVHIIYLLYLGAIQNIRDAKFWLYWLPPPPGDGFLIPALRESFIVGHMVMLCNTPSLPLTVTYLLNGPLGIIVFTMLQLFSIWRKNCKWLYGNITINNLT